MLQLLTVACTATPIVQKLAPQPAHNNIISDGP
jgi:hypothetical protein